MSVEMVRKRIKNVNLKVYPPDGAVRVSAPFKMPVEQVEAVVRERLDWIERHRTRFASVATSRSLDQVSGEVVNVLGVPHLLRFKTSRNLRTPRPTTTHRGTGPSALDSSERTAGTDAPELLVTAPLHAGYAARKRALQERLRAIAREEFAAEVGTRSRSMAVPEPTVHVRRMTSRWGTCHVHAGKVYLNLALVTRPRECLEYVVVHELAHLVVPDHSRRFWQVVERYLPGWRAAQRRLKEQPLWADPLWGKSS